ncbi:MAG: YkgJ family cysteine cluster protein [Bacteroidota bacterium]
MKMFDFSPGNLAKTAKLIEPDLRKAFATALKTNKINLDNIIHDLHDKATRKFNCLECGNCCRSLGPRILEKDIDRLSKSLKIKPKAFIEKYLLIDEDNDFIFKSMPCPFLCSDNYCSVYENRPKACCEYPHTDRNKIHQIREIIIKNNSVCPISLWISNEFIKSIH